MNHLNTNRTAPSASPWHAGERSIHQRMGIAAQMENFGPRVIRDHMPEQHQLFYAQLPFMVVGAVDAQGRPWATLLEGAPGFMHSPHPRRLDITALPTAGDPVHAALRTGTPLGLLGIELHSRRRNRLNGHTIAQDRHGVSVQVDQAFGNCPQYIQKRGFHFARLPGQPFTGAVEVMDTLDDSARAAITAADTFFVASHFPGDVEHPEPSVDVSHRGGKPGFVQVQGNMLRIPDFAGNMHFNTLGNLLANPRAGLVFVDFANGDLLQISGITHITFQSPEVDAFQGAERLWTLTVESVVRRRNALALRWTFQETSPHANMTGSWAQAQAKLQAATLSAAWRPYRVERLVDESHSVRSFYLAPADGLAAPTFQAGQHLPIRVTVPGESRPVLRTYTLSAAPSDAWYRLSVQRSGRVPRYLHDHVGVGDVLEARAPQGHFVVDALAHRPVVLLAAGIGITPLLAMLRHIVFEGQRKRRVRPTVLVYATRTHADRGFEKELAELAQRGGTAIRIVRVLSQPEPNAVVGVDFDVQGHIDTALLNRLLPLDDPDYYLCGPGAFMQATYDRLRSMHVRDERIHAEAFGPSALQREDNPAQPAAARASVATHDVPVVFRQSGQEARWTPDTGSLLELAEQCGLAPAFGCRGGSCGTCSTRVLEGTVTYTSPPAFHTEPGEALICCALPAQGVDGVAGRVVLGL